MKSRLLVAGGILAGSVLGAIGQQSFDRFQTHHAKTFSPFPQNIHVEYQEGSSATRCSSLTKYGAPRRSASVSCYNNHALSYDQANKIPHWVAEHLTQDNLKGSANRKNIQFKSDPNIPHEFSAQNADYKNSGYSRGHMAPAGDNKISMDAMRDTFYLSNIVPQNYDNNAGFWNRFEMFCRDLTKVYENVYIISGPVMVPQKDADGKKYIKYEVIGENNVAAPSHLYKVIVADNGVSGQPALGAFIVPNVPISFDHKLPEYQVPLEQVEQHTGLTFVPNLTRSQTQDLCTSNGCKLQTKEEFRLYIINRQLQNANNMEKLEKTWNKFQRDGIKPDAWSQNMYNNKREQFMKGERTQQSQRG